MIWRPLFRGEAGPNWLSNPILILALALITAGARTAVSADSVPTVNPHLGILIGQVTDAVDGHPVGGVRIEVRGQVTETDAGGNYRLANIPLGGLSPTFDADIRRGPQPLTVQFHGDTLPAGVGMSATAAGYAPYSSDRIVLIPSEVVLHHFSMTPLPAPGSLRLVLNWGAEPRDLDAHLGTPPIEDKAYEIYFPEANKGSLVKPPFAALDIDQVKGFGPETITINQFFPGTYRYFVFNYSGYVNSSPVPLTGSGATVKLYTESGEAQSITIPEAGTGLWWHVCDLDGASQSIRVVNVVTNRTPIGAALPAPATVADASGAARPPPRARLQAGGGIAFRWDFGDGTFSGEQNPSKTYETPGTFTVSLTVVAGGETNTTVKPGFITVLPVDAAPTLDPIPDLALTQNSSPRALPLNGISAGLRESQQTVTLTTSVSGPELFSEVKVDYAPPATNGVLTLSPIRGRSGTNFVTVILRDDGETSFGGTNEFRRTFQVRLLPNRPPTIDFIPVLAVDELSPLRFRMTATDPELPNSRLAFRLVNSPPGMQLDMDGQLSWTPSEGQGPYDAYTVTAEVTDDGTPALRVSTRFFVSVREVNSPPRLGLAADPVTDELVPFRLQLPVADPDVPANSHRFRLLGGPPGLTVSASGLTVWNPREENGPSTNRVVVEITDNGIPPLTTTNAFDVVVREVNAPPAVRLTSPTSGSAFGIGRAVTLEATASDADPDGVVESVAFYAGPRRLGVITTPPYRFLWTNPPAGPQSLTARATDDQGATTISSPVLVAIEGNCTPRPEGLVLWLAGDQDSADRLGTNHAAWASSPTYATGLIGDAFDLRGNDAFVSVPDHPSLNPTNGLTLALWLYRDAVVGTSDVVASKLGGTVGDPTGFSLEFAWWNPNLVRFVLQTANGLRSSGTLSIPLQRWTHVAAVYDRTNTTGANVLLYVDGIPATPSASTGAPLLSASPLQFGHDPTNPDRRFRGLVDEIVVANRALAAVELRDIVAARSSGLCPPVLPPANHAPTLAAVAPVELPEDSPPVDIRLAGISPGEGDAGQTVTVTAISDNPELLPDPLVSYIPPDSSALLTLQPRPGRHGTAQVTLVVKDDGGTERGGVDTLARTLEVQIREVNDPPRLSRPADLLIAEDSPAPPFPLDADDEETPVADLVFEFAPSNLELLPPGSFVVSGSGADRRVQVVPATNQFGSSTIAVTVRDASGAFARTEFLFSAHPVNDPPTLDPIPDLELLEDTQVLSLRLKGISPGPANETGQSLALTAVSDNPALLPDPGIEYVSPDADAILTLTPNPNQGGSARVRVTIRDTGGTDRGGLDTLVREFKVTLRAVNDPPTLTLPASLTVDEDTAGAVVPVEIEDNETAAAELLLSAVAADPRLVPTNGVQFAGTGSRRTLLLSPARNQSGTTPVVVEVRDAEGAVARAELVLTVRPVNDPPTLDPLADLALFESADPVSIPLTGITAGPTNEVGQALTLAVQSDNPDLLPPPTAAYTSPDPTGTLTLRPAAGRSGTAHVTVTLTDTGGTSRGGIDTLTRSFTVRVQPVNDPPRIGALRDLVLDEDSGRVDVPLDIADPETSLDELTLLAEASQPALFPGSNLVFRATGAGRSLGLTPAPDHSGTARVTVTVRDPFGAQAETAFLVTVRPVNDAPSLEPLPDLEIDEDAAPVVVPLTGIRPGPADEAAQSLGWTIQSDAPDLVSTPTLAYQPPAAVGALTLRPEPDHSGLATITVSLRDDGGTEPGGSNTITRSFAVRVRPINDPPTLNPIPDLVLRQNTGPVIVGLAGLTAGPADENQALTVTATSDRPELISDPMLAYSTPARDGQLTLQPASGRSGLARITITVRDDGGTAGGGLDTFQRQFEVLVRSNRPPVVALTRPTDLAVFDPTSPVALLATASDPDGSVARVEFLANETVLGQSTGPIFAWSWTNPPVGLQTLVARATDNDGTTSRSAPVSITLQDPTGIDLSSPAPGAVFCPETPLILAATLHGLAPSGSRVTFRAGSEVLGVADAPPYTLVDRAGLPGGTYEIRATLSDALGSSLAESAPARISVREACGDVAILGLNDNPEVETMRTLLSAEDMGYIVEVFDPAAVTASELGGYHLVVWTGLSRPGETLTDDAVRQLSEVHAAGRPLYLIGSRLASDRSLLGPAGVSTWESLTGLRPREDGSATPLLALNRGEPGDPIADGPYGLVADRFAAQPPVEATQLVGTGHDVKVFAGASPAFLVAPVVCAPDLGQARLAVQDFTVGGAGDAEGRLQRERLFKNTVTWLLRGWYCENVGLTLTTLQAPTTGRTGDALTCLFEIQQSGGCGAQGVTLSLDLPTGWEATDVESTVGTWSPGVGNLVVSMGCMDRGATHRVTVRLRPSLPGAFTLTAALRADAVDFLEEFHQVRNNVRIEGAARGPSLDIRPSGPEPGTQFLVRLRGEPGSRYRLQRSADLRTWQDVGVLTGPEAEVALSPEAVAPYRFLRAVTP